MRPNGGCWADGAVRNVQAPERGETASAFDLWRAGKIQLKF